MLELKDVTFQVENGGEYQEIIRSLSMKIEDNKLIVVTGPNGGGKSTLARLIMGIEKPSDGKIFFDGIDITDMPIHERSRLGIGYAFQQPPRFKGMRVRDLLSLAHGSELEESRCCSYLTDVGLCSQDYLEREVDATLSGGEMKRIEIATLLARDLKLAIFDEPEAGIDLWSFAKLVETFEYLHSHTNTSILLISHQERIMKLAEEIIVLDHGSIRDQGRKEDMLGKLINEFDEGCEFKKQVKL